eukprot:jgi/Bigna1/92143/estExt_fgenesh1_pm.C_40030
MGATCKPAKGPSVTYLDYNATTPIDPRVQAVMQPLLSSGWGNPSSSHVYGKVANAALKAARQKVAAAVGCADSNEIVFTSGGTESINHAIRGAAFASKRIRYGGNHIIISSIEHVAVSATCRYLQDHHGFKVTTLPVDGSGRVSPEALKKAITRKTVVVSIMMANNEVGTIQPIAELVKVAKAASKKIIFHTDASQAVGKIDVNVQELGVDLLTIAGHKLYAPKGIGALYIRNELPVTLEPLIHGAGHEMGRRAGTENILLAAGLGEACQIAKQDLEERMRHMKLCRDHLQRKIMDEFKGALVRINGDEKARLPNTLSISFHGLASHEILHDIQDLVACSAGSACHSNEVRSISIRISHVLAAMKVPLDFAKGTLRLSTGINTTIEEADKAAKFVCETNIPLLV